MSEQPAPLEYLPKMLESKSAASPITYKNLLQAFAVRRSASG
jgi:hypothetical protein